MLDKEFAKGIWFTIEYLVCNLDQPTIAKEIIFESAIDVTQFRNILTETGYCSEILGLFLDEIEEK